MLTTRERVAQCVRSTSAREESLIRACRGHSRALRDRFLAVRSEWRISRCFGPFLDIAIRVEELDDGTMSVPFTRTLRFKVRPESHAWLNAAAFEVNCVFNYCNEISFSTATRTDRKRKWLSGYDLCTLTAGATEYFQRIGAGTIQRICVEYAQKRVAARRLKLRWRVSR